MTPIRNVSDRERQLQAEIDALKLALVAAQLALTKVTRQFTRAGGLKDTTARCEAHEAIRAIYTALNPQGHTREQIGLAQDDRREGLTAHHVYCRTVTEDV